MRDGLARGTVVGDDHRRAASLRLDHREPERLAERKCWVEQRLGDGEQLYRARTRDPSVVLDVVACQLVHAMRQIRLPGNPVVAHEVKLEAELPREIDREMRPLNLGHSRQEQIPIATRDACALSVEVEIDPVVGRPRRDAPQLGNVRCLIARDRNDARQKHRRRALVHRVDGRVRHAENRGRQLALDLQNVGPLVPRVVDDHLMLRQPLPVAGIRALLPFTTGRAVQRDARTRLRADRGDQCNVMSTAREARGDRPDNLLEAVVAVLRIAEWQARQNVAGDNADLHGRRPFKSNSA